MNRNFIESSRDSASRLVRTGSSRMESILIGIGAVCALLVFSSCQTEQGAPFPEQRTASGPVILAPGDVIKLTFPSTPDLNQTQKIQADGKVNLSLIGEVTAAGKTLTDFQNELKRLYSAQLKYAEVVVTLESAVMQVVVSGAVAKPAKLLFERPTTVVQAIMEAGGLNEYGTFKNVHVIRLINGRQRTQILDLRPTLRGQATQPFYVRDGDVIYVPRGPF